jgi:hypothetical protein
MKTPEHRLVFLLLALIANPAVAGAPPGAPPRPAPSEAAFGGEILSLGGVVGHRIDRMIKGNLYQLDMEKTFLSFFRKRDADGKTYRGLGKTLDAAVHFAALTSDLEIVRWKDKWIDELIATQEPDGYIGTFPPGLNRYVGRFDTHEKGPIILALTNDYRFFGRGNSLRAARRLADEIITHWPDEMPHNRLWTVEYPLILLSETSGDSIYVDWVRKTFFPGGQLCREWALSLGGNPVRPLKLWGAHVYRWCDVNIAMLDLDRHFPNPTLTSAWPQMMAWLKDGGSLPTGSFADHEGWRRSQTTRSMVDPDPETRFIHTRTKICESCAKFYVVQLLDRVQRQEPATYYGDVIERTVYNGLFASQSPEGRRIVYDLSVEGTRMPYQPDWYCCPGNLRRAFAYLPHYLYFTKGERVFVNLYAESDVRMKLGGGAMLRLVQKTDYPSSGAISFKVEVSAPQRQEILFRIPAWCRAPKVRVGGGDWTFPQPGSYHSILREWRTGDTVELDFPMEWRWLSGIREQEGRAALARGPLIYSLSPSASGISEYEDLDPKSPRPLANPVPRYAEHARGFDLLASVTIDPATLTPPELDERLAFGSKVSVGGWMGRPAGPPTRRFVFRNFANPEGRKIYVNLPGSALRVKDELFGIGLHEDTVYPERWSALRAGLRKLSLPDLPESSPPGALRLTPLRGAHDFETAEGEIAGQRAWMAASLANTGKRFMQFRVFDPRFQDIGRRKLTFTVVYLDRGDCTVSLDYDARDETRTVDGQKSVKLKRRGEFSVGSSGQLKVHRFTLDDAEFGRGVKIEGPHLQLGIDREVDFVILGAHLEAGL